METKDWGNNAPERVTPAQHYQHAVIDYNKLFWVIVGAILTSVAIMTLVSFLFASAIFYTVLSSFNQTFSLPTVPASVRPPPSQVLPMPQPIQRQPALPAPATPKKQKEDFERAAVLTCQFWRDQYEKDGLEASKKNRDRTCAQVKP